MKLLGLKEIKQYLKGLDLIPLIEQGFVAYSQGKAIVPPVGELLIEENAGEVHIKYGLIKQDDIYVIKIASGFYNNANLGLPSSNGMMLVFKQETGEALAVLHDEGYLTDIRTAVAGAIAAKHLAPKNINRIAVVGTGIQARLQLQYLKQVTNCRDVMIWGRNARACEAYAKDIQAQGFKVQTAHNTQEIMQHCQLIITTTPSKTPLLHISDLQAGTHITAVGADTPEKQELDAEILAKADLVVVDSTLQCKRRGEASHALKQKLITEKDMLELGSVISGGAKGRTNEKQITVADLTGVAVQDIQIAKAVYFASGISGDIQHLSATDRLGLPNRRFR